MGPSGSGARRRDSGQAAGRGIYENALGLGDILLPRPLAERHAAVELDDAVFMAGPAARRSLLIGVRRAVPTATVLTRQRYRDGVHSANRTSAWIVWLLIGRTRARMGGPAHNARGRGVWGASGELAVAPTREGKPGWHIVVPPVLFGGIIAGAALGLIGSLLPGRIALRARRSVALGLK
jgi:hypothetical protein